MDKYALKLCILEPVNSDLFSIVLICIEAQSLAFFFLIGFYIFETIKKQKRWFDEQ